MTLESSFGHLLTVALQEWCDIGRYEGRRLDELPFNFRAHASPPRRRANVFRTAPRALPVFAVP